MSAASSAYDQATYQIRFDWGQRAVRVLAPAHITVVIDALPGPLELDLDGVEGHVVHAGLADRSAVARWVLARQHENGGRTSVNVVAAGDVDDAGEARFAMEDQLAAGALIDALIELGIDHVSPDAAVASASFEGLRRACSHLLSASASGRLLTAEGRGDEVAAAARVDSIDTVTVLRERR